ncbi:MAG: hypothetical protein P9F19_17420 [Candidatus Contendobacter sp.]|nr:hypothetical protein [Candidatus Contendobacter sp.]MDG4559148.1 hypothetical protein [Candidatus Contendobacter sp.]
MIDRPGLSYGLFHLHAQPIKLYGTLTTRVDFKGLNLDIGHLRALRWSKVNDPPAWVAYNRMRGQQASALEHATPEQFWVDRNQCRYTDENGQTVNPNLPDCPQAVSAVKALAIAARQGQKIYTITAKNAAVALPQLSVSRSVAAEIRNAVAAGKEVTVHEKAINAYGFSGVGYIIVDPDTGSGAYLIEGGGSGGSLATKIGLALGYTLAILGLLIMITTIAYSISLVIIEYLAIQATTIAASNIIAAMSTLFFSSTETLSGPWATFFRDIALATIATMASVLVLPPITAPAVIVGLVLAILAAIIDAFVYPSR